jgi:DNA-binding transcriptional ArsR family regulator
VKTLRWFPNTPAADPLVELVAQRLRVLGQPLRIKLLQALCEQPATVQELATGVGAVQQNVSQHLSILHQAGILIGTRTERTFNTRSPITCNPVGRCRDREPRPSLRRTGQAYGAEIWTLCRLRRNSREPAASEARSANETLTRHRRATLTAHAGRTPASSSDPRTSRRILELASQMRPRFLVNSPDVPITRRERAAAVPAEPGTNARGRGPMSA